MALGKGEYIEENVDFFGRTGEEEHRKMSLATASLLYSGWLWLETRAKCSTAIMRSVSAVLLTIFTGLNAPHKNTYNIT